MKALRVKYVAANIGRLQSGGTRCNPNHHQLFEVAAMTEPHLPYGGPIVTREDAVSLGLNKYFIGESCKHGHIAQRYIIQNRCERCRFIYCMENREERKEACKNWHSAHPGQNQLPHVKVRKKEWFIQKYYNTPEFKERRDAAAKKWSLNNAKLIACRKRVKYSHNPQKFRKAAIEFYKKNTNECKERSRNWKRSNKLATKAHNNNRRARIKNADGKHTASDIKRLVFMQKNKCAVCKASLKSGYQIDHIHPLALGGTNWPRNLQLLCPPCNLSKHAKDPITFMQGLGFLL